MAYILATNINRRHLSKGQRAMAVAKLYPEPEKGGRGKTVTKNVGVSGQYITEARTVLRWLPELADLVMAGAKPLNEAYQEAQRLKEQTDAEPLRLVASDIHGCPRPGGAWQNPPDAHRLVSHSTGHRARVLVAGGATWTVPPTGHRSPPPSTSTSRDDWRGSTAASRPSTPAGPPRRSSPSCSSICRRPRPRAAPRLDDTRPPLPSSRRACVVPRPA